MRNYLDGIRSLIFHGKGEKYNLRALNFLLLNLLILSLIY